MSFRAFEIKSRDRKVVELNFNILFIALLVYNNFFSHETLIGNSHALTLDLVLIKVEI